MEVLTALTESLWYMDPHWDKLAMRSYTIPQFLHELQGYNDWRAQKKKMPRISADELNKHIGILSDILSIPWFANSKFSTFREAFDELCDKMVQYHRFLTDQATRTSVNHHLEEPVRPFDDSWKLQVIEGGGLSYATNSQYEKLKNELGTCNLYEEIATSTFEPDDPIERRSWIKNLKLPYPVSTWTYSFGNYLGNTTFIWKLPVNKDDRDSSEDVEIVARIKKKIPQYQTRQMRHNFVDRYAKLPGLKPAILRSINTFLTGDTTAASSAAEAAVDERLLEFLAISDDTDLIWDLRVLNGRPRNPKFDLFWQELGRFLDEKCAVNERRHGDHLYLPLAISVDDLRQQIIKRLPSGTATPSESWVRMNFWPSNAYTRTAMAYTGQFKVKFSVQQRLSCAQHPDAKFAAYQFTIMKNMAVKWREHAEFFSMDDKAIIPVGEPDQVLSTGVRAHHGSLVPAGMKLSALDHDFHVCGLVPSVTFHIEIPEDAGDSFYTGAVHMTLKDKIFEPSSPARHAAEFVKLVRHGNDSSGPLTSDGLNLRSPILLVYTDGGPDHRTTYRSVQMMWIAVFLALDLDLLVAARTAPCQSYANPAERTMSLFNLALQNVALRRERMDEKSEAMMKSASSMKVVRMKADKTTTLKGNLLQAMQPVVELLNDRFSRLTWKEEKVQVHEPCSEEDIQNLQEILRSIDSEINLETCFKDKTALSDFISKHCNLSHYMFQVKKCGNCGVCDVLPARLPEDDFKDLHFLPHPVLKEDRYMDFAQVYGTETNDADRPALKDNPQPTDNDKKLKSLLVAAKTRSWIACSECDKRRVIYSANRLTKNEELALVRLKEETIYICGNSLFCDDHDLSEKLVVRESLNCESNIEIPYYSAVTKVFDPICCLCGSTQVYEGPETAAFKEQFGTVRPICKCCLDKGCQPLVRCTLIVKKARKQ